MLAHTGNPNRVRISQVGKLLDDPLRSERTIGRLRPADEVSKLFLKKATKKVKKQHNKENKVHESSSNGEKYREVLLEEKISKSVDSTINVDSKEAEILEKNLEKDQIVVKVEDLNSDLSAKELEDMSVAELRTLARSLNLKTMTKKQIKFEKKKNLIEEIRRHKDGSGK